MIIRVAKSLLGVWFAAFLMTSCIQPIVSDLKEIPLTDSGDHLPSYSWSPDGEHILLNWIEQPYGWYYDRPLNGFIGWVEPMSGVVNYLPEQGYQPLWSPDGSAILFNSGNYEAGNYQLQLFYLATERLISLPPLPYIPLMWQEEGVYYQIDDGLWRAQLDDFATLADEPVWSVHEHIWEDDTNNPDVIWYGLSPNEKYIVMLENFDDEEKRRLNIYDLADQTDPILEIQKTPDSVKLCCTWSRDSQKFAFSAFEPTYGLYIADLAEQQVRQIVSVDELGDGRIFSLNFSPDDEKIAFEWSNKWSSVGNNTFSMDEKPFGDTQLYLTDLAGKQVRRITADDSGTHNYVRWSPTDERISFQRDDEIWIADTSLANQPNVVTASITFPEIEVSDAANYPQKEVAGFTLVERGDCPTSIILPPVAGLREELPDASVYPFDTVEHLIHMLASSSELTLRRVAAEENDFSSALLRSSYLSDLIYYHLVYDSSIYYTPPMLSLEFASLTEFDPTSIFTVAEKVQSKIGITCHPPEVVEVGPFEALLVQHQLSAEAMMPVVNSLMWLEEDSWWHLSALAPESGGEYVATDLVEIARTRLEEYVSGETPWRPIFRIH